MTSRSSFLILVGALVARPLRRRRTPRSRSSLPCRHTPPSRGDRGRQSTVTSIGRGDENPHYVQPRPSFALDLQRADMFVSTGLDLELWVPALLDKAGNSKVNDGGPGYVTPIPAFTFSTCQPPPAVRR